MAVIAQRLVTNGQKLRAEQLKNLRAALEPLRDEMPVQIREIVSYVARQTASEGDWSFLLMSPTQFEAVVDWLEHNSRRPLKAVRLWSALFTALDRSTGEVMFTREQIAERVGVLPRVVSEIMGELESIKAVVREREKIAGMRGPGRVRYFLNPLVGTHLAGMERDDAQAAAPPLRTVPLRAIEGGRPA